MTIAVFALWVAFQSAEMQSGIGALDAGKFEEAERIFEKAVAADPKDYSALFHLSLAQTFVNKDEAAMAGFRKVLEMKPDLFEAELNLALLLHRHRKFDEAAPMFEAALKHKPGEIRATYNLAESYRELGRCDAAERWFLKTLELDPKMTAAQLGIGRCLVSLKRLDEAAPFFEMADGQLEMAQAYEDAGALEKAVPIYEAALKAEDSLVLRTRLAAVYLKSKQFDKAEEMVAGALKQAPDDYDLHLTYGRLLRDKRQFLPAAQHFARAVQVKPDSVEALNELAGMFISLNEDARAIAVLDRLKTLGAEIPGHMFFRAVVLDRNKQVKPALAAYQAFLAASNGEHPDEEFKARQRARILEKEARR